MESKFLHELSLATCAKFWDENNQSPLAFYPATANLPHLQMTSSLCPSLAQTIPRDPFDCGSSSGYGSPGGTPLASPQSHASGGSFSFSDAFCKR